MNKEPLGLYIFRFIMGFGLFAFMCLLYWSSLLLEEDMLDIRNDLSDLRNEITSLRADKSLEGLPSRQSAEAPPAAADQGQSTLMDSAYLNLLTEDPFYKNILPKMLGANFKPAGTFQNDTIGKPDNLHPFSNWLDISTWTGMASASVSSSHFGIYESYAPDLALKMEERKNPKTQEAEYWIHLRPNVYWKPLGKNLFPSDFKLAPHFFEKHLVTSEDFKFYFDALMNPYNQEPGAVSARVFYDGIKEIEVIDDRTFVVRWKTVEVEENGKKVRRIRYIAKQLTGGLRPLPSFLYKYFPDGKKIIEDDSNPETYRTNSVWAQNFSQHWAKNVIPSCGAWIFDGMTDRQITFVRNPDHYNPLDALAASIEWQFKDTPEAIWQDFKINKTDSYTLQPEQVAELEMFLKSDVYKEQAAGGAAIKRLDFLARRYTYIGWNQAKPFFKSRKVRQALTMSIDRQRIIREILNGMGEEINGPFFKNSPSYDLSIEPWPYDPDKARRYLEEEGWFDRDNNGVLENIIEGKKVPFVFSLTYYVKNQISKSICEYVATALKEVGIGCSLKGVDTADLSADFDDKNFDALLMGWALGSPPEDPKQLWSSAGMHEKGSSNAVGFSNAEADKIIDALDYEYDQDIRNQLYHRFDKIIHEEQPYTFLYTPKTSFVYREYLQNVFIPSERQDLVPGANVAEPQSSVFWLKKHN